MLRCSYWCTNFWKMMKPFELTSIKRRFLRYELLAQLSALSNDFDLFSINWWVNILAFLREIYIMILINKIFTIICWAFVISLHSAVVYIGSNSKARAVKPSFSWSIFIRAVIDHMICYNLNWPKIKTWVHYFVFSCD